MKINVYTDGACSLQSEMSPGGWGVVVRVDDEQYELGSYELETTNNKMEMVAFLTGLEEIEKNAAKGFVEECNIYTDSAYIANCFKDKWYIGWQNNGWKTSKKEPVKNVHLWKPILEKYHKLQVYGLQVVKVKGHSDNEYNNLADVIAVKCKNGRYTIE